MNFVRLFSMIAISGALCACPLVGCSSNNDGGNSSGNGCHVNTGHCHDCGVASCGDKANATFGANWQNLDFSGGACASVLSCQCGCGAEPVCAAHCAESASDTCRTAASDLQKCLDNACFGCQAFEIGPMPPTPTFDGGFDSPGFDSPGFDTTPLFDTTPSCLPDGQPCASPDQCCSLACNASNVCGT
jgi:hypothetical protein